MRFDSALGFPQPSSLLYITCCSILHGCMHVLLLFNYRALLTLSLSPILHRCDLLAPDELHDERPRDLKLLPENRLQLRNHPAHDIGLSAV